MVRPAPSRREVPARAEPVRSFHRRVLRRLRVLADRSLKLEIKPNTREAVEKARAKIDVLLAERDKETP